MFGYRKRTMNIFNPKSKDVFKLSRTKIERFIECPRCFYLDRRLGLDRPSGFPFTLNSAVDKLLKKEFDIHRAKKEKHPLMETYKINAIPFVHEKMDEWRENFVGVQALHKPTNLLIFGAVDDIWENKDGSLSVVDYKATSTTKEITLEEEYRKSYKRQMEIYQWLLRQNGFNVSDDGYFVYVNGLTDKEAFDGKLEFDVQVLKYTGNDDWVEKAITDAHKCLMGNKIPKASWNCDYCKYREEMKEVE
ncbi:MAG: PD-(D/E)XK nuclease family protein [Patescibacteria group bacterium]|nr:PD-(D/E)XK nuclease family protein [Patescibacteria group bacterium]